MNIYIGYDPRESDAYRACIASIVAHNRGNQPLNIQGINSRLLGNLYTRPTERRNGVMYDTISCAPMATEFSLARFWAPYLNGSHQWALFMDCDFMFRADVAELMALADPQYAVQVVKHQQACEAGAMKMDGQPQVAYRRKNWSSLMLFNCHHENVRALHPDVLNAVSGLTLHQFLWCRDEEIGALPEAWNWLEGISSPSVEPKAVHYTRGVPSMPGYEGSAYAAEWGRYAGR